MARQVLPIVGAVVGAFFGAPQIGYAIGSIIGAAVDPEVIKGPRIGEAGLQTSAEGVFRPIVKGTGAIKGNVIVRGNRQVKTERTRQGKGGPVTETQRVYWTFAIRLGEPLAAILRIWQDEKLVYDARAESTIPEETAEFADKFRFYTGAEDQLPDPDLEAFQGVGNAHAYPGTAYVVFPNFDLTDRRESIPDFRFEVTGALDDTPVPIPVLAAGVGTDVILRSIAGGVDFDESFHTGVDAPVGVATLVEVLNGKIFHFAENGDAMVSNPAGGFQAVQGLPTSPIGYRAIMCGFWLGGTYYVFPTDDYVSDWYSSGDGVGFIPNPDYPVGALSQPKHCCLTFGDSLGLVGQGTGYLGITEDAGLTWRQYQAIPGRGFAINFLARVGVSFIAASSIDNTTLMRSANAQEGSWSEIDFPGRAGPRSIRGMAVGNGRLLIALDNGDTWYSDNAGTSWTQGATVSGGGIGGAYNCLIYSGGNFIGTVAGVQRIVYSPNGVVPWQDGYNVPSVGTAPRSLAPYDVSQSGIAGEPVPLAKIVAWAHERADQGPETYDVAELTDLVFGVVFAGDYTAADAISTLMPVYFFDASEYDSGSGYRIHYPKRGKPVVTTLTLDSIVEAPEKAVREDALERPKALHLHYENPTIGYAAAKATTIRSSPDVRVVGERSVQVPVAFVDVDEPAQVSDRLMRIAWVEVAGEEQFTVPDHLLGLVPGDCVGVSLRGQVRRMRITGQEIAPGTIRLRMMNDRQSAYTSNVTGVPVPLPTPPLPSVVGQTIYSYLDIPALNDGNDRLGWYDAASGQTPAWFGAQTQHKPQGATEFQESTTFTQNTIMGALVEDVPAASEHYPDTTNTVRVQLYTDDAIDALTDAQFLSEGGGFALENADGSWELMQYRDAEQESSGVFALSHLARGRLLTGGSAHVVGARFVLLDGVRMVDAVTAYLNTDLTHRAVSLSASPDSATQYVEPYVGRSQIEFPPAHVLLERAGDIVTARIVPRHRFGTEDNPVQSVNWIGYRVTATDGTNTTSVDTTSASWPFNVTGWASPVTVTASQLNRFTGAGPSLSESIA